jgi:putative endonuclease
MHYVYFLKSEKNGDVYIGCSDDLRRRFAEHNSGKVRSTGPNRPWKLIGYEAYRAKSDATEREYFLKSGQQRELLRVRLQNSLKI